MMPAPMGVCFKQDATREMAQSFCRLGHVPECSAKKDEKKNDDALQYQCYMRCATTAKTQEDGLHYYNCTEYDMECYEGVTCILPPKARVEDEEDGY